MIVYDSEWAKTQKTLQWAIDTLNQLMRPKYKLLVIWDKQTTDFIENPFLFASFLEKAQHERSGWSVATPDIVWCMNKRFISMDDVMGDDWEIKE